MIHTIHLGSRSVHITSGSLNGPKQTDGAIALSSAIYRHDVSLSTPEREYLAKLIGDKIEVFIMALENQEAEECVKEFALKNYTDAVLAEAITQYKADIASLIEQTVAAMPRFESLVAFK